MVFYHVLVNGKCIAMHFHIFMLCYYILALA